MLNDRHTSIAILPESFCQKPVVPSGINWYQPLAETTPLQEHNTFLLMSDSMDRSAGIGFRCVSE